MCNRLRAEPKVINVSKVVVLHVETWSTVSNKQLTSKQNTVS